ncbi:MAG: LysM peptidoglycan-binding domain-containing protein [Bacteroidota bacterium]
MDKKIRLLLLILPPFILFGCSSHQSAKISSSSPVNPPLDSTAEQQAPASVVPDSVVENLEPDTALTVREVITQKMEEARLHYRAALDAQAAGDSMLSSQEFEEAIEVLNALSYYPEAEENEEFDDLIQSVIEDYERYIASIDELGPESSVFALREKLNQIVELIDISGIRIPKRIFKGTQVPFVVNEHVERNVAFYLTKGKEHLELWLYRSGKYFPHMKRIFQEEGVPEELVHLSMMESGLNPAARSWMRAVGQWQFMRGTGRLYGLKGNWWYDERRDFEKSTRAAARLLKDLYERFDDWYLAIAAYNSGAGRINRAIRRSGSKDFWTMRRYLPRQTRNFVPQYLAVAMMAMSPEEFGFQGITPAPALEFDMVTIDDCVDLTVLAKAAETDVETIHELNPELLRWSTPPGYRGYGLRIPKGKADIFASNYAEIPDDQKRDWVVHRVRRGETLSGISKKYGILMGLILETNKIRNKHRLSVGQTIVIPVPVGSARYAGRVSRAKPERRRAKARTVSRKASSKQLAYADKAKVLYRIRRGDTIGHIAEWFDTRASRIRMWNDIPYGSIIRENEQLVIWVPERKHSDYEKLNDFSFEEKQRLESGEVAEQRSNASKSRSGHWVDYKVRWGDTLGEIAAMFGSSVDDLKSWNGLRSNKIKAGQTLLVLVGEKESNGTVATNGRDSSEHSYVLHKVRKGESLYTIARLHGVSIREVQDWNQLRSSRIYAGQELRIYNVRG